LPVFERQVLRRIYGAVQTEEGRGIGNNDELEKLTRGEDIKYIRAERINWCGHVNRIKKKSEEDYGMESHRNENQRTSKK
jgi:hypothetical protein